MTTRQPRYSKEEFALRGDEIYDRDIRPRLDASDQGMIVAIDIGTGAWEMDTDEMAAGQRLAARCPDAQTWVVRVGSPAVRRFGMRTPGPGVITGTVNADLQIDGADGRPLVGMSLMRGYELNIHAVDGGSRRFGSPDLSCPQRA